VLALGIFAAVRRGFLGLRDAQDGAWQEVHGSFNTIVQSIPQFFTSQLFHALVCVFNNCFTSCTPLFLHVLEAVAHARDRFYKGLRWFKRDAEPVVIIPGHNQHHRYTSPVIFDAFSGSLYATSLSHLLLSSLRCNSDVACRYDTTLLILIPLYITSRICFWVNTRTWAAFGSTYSCWFLLIHSEVVHPWDPVLAFLGLGTPGDHAVHHAVVVKNFAHYFPILDKLTGSYRSPEEVFARHLHPAASPAACHSSTSSKKL
jgi:hypothetical protein